jgi:hypothetical protein
VDDSESPVKSYGLTPQTPRGAQEAMDEAMGYRDEFGKLTDPG